MANSVIALNATHEPATATTPIRRTAWSELSAKPLDRALLAVFAELVQATGIGPVADPGCGPGRVTAHLHSLGLTAFGVDLSLLARLIREPDEPEKLQQAYLLARKPVEP